MKFSHYLQMSFMTSLLLLDTTNKVHEQNKIIERKLTEIEKDQISLNYKKECAQKYKNNLLPKKLRKKLKTNNKPQ